jgi:hypothetical protein
MVTTTAVRSHWRRRGPVSMSTGRAAADAVAAIIQQCRDGVG